LRFPSLPFSRPKGLQDTRFRDSRIRPCSLKNISHFHLLQCYNIVWHINLYYLVFVSIHSDITIQIIKPSQIKYFCTKKYNYLSKFKQNFNIKPRIIKEKKAKKMQTLNLEIFSLAQINKLCIKIQLTNSAVSC